MAPSASLHRHNGVTFIKWINWIKNYRAAYSLIFKERFRSNASFRLIKPLTAKVLWIVMWYYKCVPNDVSDFRANKKENANTGTPCGAITWRVCISDKTFTFVIHATNGNILTYVCSNAIAHAANDATSIAKQKTHIHDIDRNKDKTCVRAVTFTSPRIGFYFLHTYNIHNKHTQTADSTQ